MGPAAHPNNPDASAQVGIGLRLQRLTGPLQVLSVGSLAAMEADDASFTTRQVADLLMDLRMPRHANLSATLGRLEKQHLVVRPAKGRWALTPAGLDKLQTEAGHVTPRALAAELHAAPGSQLGRHRHATVPPILAPAGVELGLRRLFARSSFERNVMLISRFPKGPDDPIARVIERVQASVESHGMQLHLASDAMNQDTLWDNVVTYMWGCQYAVVLIDGTTDQVNPNVLIEVGGMLMTGRRCAILRDVEAPQLPTDLVGHIYKPVHFVDVTEVDHALHGWLAHDLGRGVCDDCVEA
jgi:hypothetical protein